MPNILILTGGPSPEANIARNTGALFSNTLITMGFSPKTIELTISWQQDILNQAPDFVFLALHGCPGEDGVVQQFLEHHNIPYQGSDSAVSALLMNKSKAKALFQNEKLPVVSSAIVTNATTDCPLNFPVFVKPLNGGSTIGCNSVKKSEEWSSAITNALIYDKKILIEPFLAGQEYTVAMWNNEPIAAIKITPKSGGTYDYDAKYSNTDTNYTFLASENPLTKELFKISQKAILISGARHMTRVDFMTDNDGKIYILEINTLPGMSVLYPRALAHTGRSLQDILCAILKEAHIIQQAA